MKRCRYCVSHRQPISNFSQLAGAVQEKHFTKRRDAASLNCDYKVISLCIVDYVLSVMRRVFFVLSGILAITLIQGPWAHRASAQESNEGWQEQRVEVEFSSARRPVAVEVDSGVAIFYVEINGRRARAMLDSGTDRSILSESFADVLGVTREMAKVPLRTFDGRMTEAGMVPGVTILVPGQIRARTDVVTMDLSGLSSAMKSPIDLIVGADLTNGLAWSYFAQADEILFEAPGIGRPQGFTELAVFDGNSIDAVVDGKVLRLKIDTGQSSALSLVSAAWKSLADSTRSTADGQRRNTSGDIVDVRIVHGISVSLAGVTSREDVSETQEVQCTGCVGAIGWAAFKDRDIVADISHGHIWVK